MEKVLNQTWDLDVVFKGGSESESLDRFLVDLESDLQGYWQHLKKTSAPQTIDEALNWKENIHKIQDFSKRIVEAGAYIGCLNAQDVKDQHAKTLNGTIQTLGAQFESCSTLLDNQMDNIPQAVWEELLKDDELKNIQFPLNESRDKAKEKLSAEQEQLVNALSIDGYHGWGELYDTIVGNMSIPFTHPEKGESNLSVGQLDNLLTDSDRNVRKSAFAAWETAWHNQSDFCSSALNHLSGFRLNLYQQRSWDKVLKEPLAYNRMTDETLAVMWDVITSCKPTFVKFLERKAELLGLEKLSWFDVEAPLESASTKVTYEESCEFIIDHFKKFNPQMAEFAAHAIENRWIEAEDRFGKRPGGFCTSFPIAEESRIFMTFSGTPDNTSTLAHELGHAYHQHVMNDLPNMAQHYAMNVAETASTFAEMIVSDAAKSSAATTEEHLAFLEDKVQRSIAFFMNIHARFLFETRFYEERKKGLVTSDRLDEIMLEAQKEAYCDALDTYHPAFWQSKLHFYITDVPFYNFPYTFGYLFSTGIYVKALEEGPSFAKKYDALLRDTGSMTVEDLAKKHLDVDLTQPDFWRSAIGYCVKDAREFLSLTEK
ncbi:pepF/M3 family oligoendopeptidase [Scopulibacillus darangshiensis]|uniref:PepF/M3 family oligoendopeptidase n=1 Tax=Scopulibacillus darangshiensis TaxID=442528 RepID=A0A4V2SLR7_9BACL|nr:M3 family oligoendopeptidase [Scopulibacillus darangshiensis]TCP24516.1 pepF/M3 family oligoendopeptidase [Scopulibacillus darangshiensis]